MVPALLALAWLAASVPAAVAQAAVAQATLQKAATVEALVAFPGFFHGEPVVVRAAIAFDGDTTWLEDSEARVLWAGEAAEVLGETVVETSGTFWDVGRLEAGDPRLAPHQLAQLSQTLLGKPWPAPGELLLLAAERSVPAPPQIAPSLRAVALDPDRYVGHSVSVTGRFRGRNLYADLPLAPAQSLSDFVLQAGDAALWVTGREPRGDGFTLHVDFRPDTSRWLEVTGRVRYAGGLVWLEASRIGLARAGARPEPVVIERTQGPAPEVIFSAPVQDDIDVERATRIRLQFSRDMDAASFENRIYLAYLGTDSPMPAFTFEYRGGNRVLEIRFAEPLPAFTTVRLELAAGFAAADGALGEAWQLSFSLGAS
jgi:hypothetical protein